MRSLCLVSLILVAGCADRDGARSPASPEQDPATRRMAQRLSAIRESQFPEHNPFRNEEKATRLAALATPSATGPRRRHLLTLGRELLFSGRTEEAIEVFEELVEHSDAGLASRTAYTTYTKWLALAQLRLGEQNNCIDRHAAASCLLPIEGGGVHLRQGPSRAAMESFREILRQDPDDVESRWLFNLAAMTVAEYPDGVEPDWRISPSAFDSEAEVRRFVDSAARRGLATVGLAGGSVVEDLDGDGDLDVMTSSWGLADELSVLINRGDGVFDDRSADSGLAGIVGGLNLVPADFDNDGDVDVLVLRGAWLGPYGNYPNSLLENDGRARFRDVTEASGVLDFFPSQTAAWADFDNDGLLDLFVGAEAVVDLSIHSRLYRNLGDGTFEEVSTTEGAAVRGFVKGVTWGDFDNDGWIDLYISRRGEPNALLRNRGAEAKPRFVDVAAAAGVEEPTDGFPAWFFDFDDDGWLDIFAASFPRDYAAVTAESVIREVLGEPVATGHPKLYRNVRDGTFEDVTQEQGLDRPLLAMGSNFGDFDGDGWEDIYVGTGAPPLGALVPNLMFRNGGGRGFLDVTTAGGFGHLQKGHGISFADLDGDGDQDVLAVMGGAYSGDRYANAFFENPGNDNAWVTLRLRGTTANRSAIGARLRLVVATAAGERTLHRVVGTGGSFGANSLQTEIGLGSASAVVRLEVLWPGAADWETFDGVEINMTRVVEQGSSRVRPAGGPAP